MISDQLNLLLSSDLRRYFAQRNSSLQELGRFGCQRNLFLQDRNMKCYHISNPSFLGNATPFPVKRYITDLVSQSFSSPFWSAEISVPGWVKPANYRADWNFPLWLTEEFSLLVGGKNMNVDHTVVKKQLEIFRSWLHCVLLRCAL